MSDKSKDEQANVTQLPESLGIVANSVLRFGLLQPTGLAVRELARRFTEWANPTEYVAYYGASNVRQSVQTVWQSSFNMPLIVRSLTDEL